MTLTPCAFFAHASPAALQFAAAHMNLLHLRRREALHLGAAADFDGLGVVLQGSVQALDLTLDGKEVSLTQAALHEPFGYAMLLAAQPIELNWVASAATTTVAVMGRAQALELMVFPEMMAVVARLNAERIRELLSWQKIQAMHPVSARVCAWLLHGHGTHTDAGLRLPTHAEIAWRLNTTRESVTRVLQRLLTDGVLQRDGETWHVLKPVLLEDLARGDER